MNIMSAYRVALGQLPIDEKDIPQALVIESLEEAYEQFLSDYPYIHDGSGSDNLTDMLEVRSLERAVGMYGLALFVESPRGKALLSGKDISGPALRSIGANALGRIKIIAANIGVPTTVGTVAQPLPDDTRHTVFDQFFGAGTSDNSRSDLTGDSYTTGGF